MKKVDLIGVQMDFGAGTRGVNMGPAAIRFAGLVNGINGLGLECLDKGDLIPPQTGKSSEKLRNYEQVNYINKKLFEGVLDSIRMDISRSFWAVTTASPPEAFLQLQST